ncbi:MAG: response regulator [bacterium]|nr:response regulator [bacterium]
MSKHILVIDDEAEFRNAVKEILSLDGYQVDIPHYLASAVASALQGIHDLIILDLRMPGLDGLEIARLFRDQGLKTPILVISGYLSDTVPAQLHQIGIQHTLPKPSGIPQLFDAVKKALAA